MPDPVDVPIPSLLWFKKTRDALKARDASLVRDFAALANQPNAYNLMMDYLDEWVPLAQGSYKAVPVDDVWQLLAED